MFKEEKTKPEEIISTSVERYLEEEILLTRQNGYDSQSMKLQRNAKDNFNPFVLKSKDGLVSHIFETQKDLDEIFLILINTCHDCFSKT